MQAPFDAFFLPVPGDAPGHRFCIFHPAQGAEAKGAVLYIHPFGEEMNKSRRMAALQSRALAAAGYAVLQIDLLGCGDSSGDFGDARWQDWIDDVVRGAQWLTDRVSAPLWLWGLRVGCLLAVEASRHLPTARRFLFWAPTPSGKQVLQQFMRLKAAGDLASGKAKTILDGLRSDLAQGRAVEIAGYRLAPALASGLEQCSLDPPEGKAEAGRIEWFEMSNREDAAISPAGVKLLTAWKQRGWQRACGYVIAGPAFWQTTEIEDAPALISATLAAIEAVTVDTPTPDMDTVK
jgi:exosortase A-associated hydrolase 2